ncbi:hypothetical protein N7457_002683 [Penicillium paradoxum]|uniref:uncharacterized protein n=1 Tax=Penicillium paradoxum TaxID=176176 RepID=UPI002547730C|nr:uncharacterized protein N7457_002683 [Penicillium paradoxum]KAJ5787693.1 hypothetical protein N7457_002683 [Penicillium paradoxum]
MRNSTKWDHDMDKQLIVAILATIERVDYGAIAEQFGTGIKAEGIRSHLRTLKAQHEAKASSSPTRDGKAGSTPRKRKPAASSKAGKDTIIDEHEEGMEPSPAKQHKMVTATSEQK